MLIDLQGEGPVMWQGWDENYDKPVYRMTLEDAASLIENAHGHVDCGCGWVKNFLSLTHLLILADIREYELDHPQESLDDARERASFAQRIHKASKHV